MRVIVTTLFLAACVTAIGVGQAPATSTASRQHVSILVTFDSRSGTGTWTLTPGPGSILGKDKGSLTGTGTVGPVVVRGGLRTTRITGSDTLTGRLGAFAMSQRIESVTVSRRYTVETGTWTMGGGLDAYGGVTGSGRLVSVGLPNGTVLARQDGWVTRR
jgi:hypothetical protein